MELHLDVQSTSQGLLEARLVRESGRSAYVVITPEIGKLSNTRVTTQDPIVAVTFVGYDDSGNLYLYVLSSISNESGILRYRSLLNKYSPDGELLASVLLPMDSYIVPEHPLIVTGDGDVYQLYVGKDQTQVIRWRTMLSTPSFEQPFPLSGPSDFDIRLQPTVNDQPYLHQKSPETNQITLDPITRDQIMSIAQSYANHTWTVGASNYDARTCSNGCPVGPAAWSIGTQVTGVAYQWGGWDTECVKHS
jgi:hypothetical protein